MNLLVGVTGILGSEVCRRLTAEGKPTRALVRSISDQAEVNKLKSYGTETVRGDLRDRASLDAACQGGHSGDLYCVRDAAFLPARGERDPDWGLRRVDEPHRSG